MAAKRVLILGGTEFVGHALVDEALARGHDVTVLNRGTREPRTDLTALGGDRTAPDGLDVLDGPDAPGEWDLVVDTWSWGPKAVTDAAAHLSARAGHYVYVSSRSVYAGPPALADESAAVVDGSADDTGYGDYARAKRGGELGAIAGFGDRTLLLRPGLVLGPRENIGRLPWWLSRIARGGEVVAPGPADAGIQYVDARDLAAFALDSGATGAVDLVTRPDTVTMRDLLETAVDVVGSDATLRWFAPERLLAAGVGQWVELPVWIAPGPDYEGMHRGGVARAFDLGFAPRPLRDTVADTWQWLRSIGGVAPQRPDRPVVGLPDGKERALLAGTS
jgi:2'-hydroxyisoflavone reductase